MWADTSTVGCGVTTYKVSRWYQVLYTCNYGPGGNYIRGEMYKQGSACSQCPSNTRCSQQYSGLCTTFGDVPRRRISVKKNKTTLQIKRTNMPSRNSSLNNCDFDSHQCNFKVRGEKWLLSEDGADNHFYDVILSPGSNTDLRLASLVPVSRTNSGLCLYLQYKKYSPGGIEQPIHIIAWPYRAVAPQKVTILSDQANWTSVEVSLSNIYSSFLLIFKFSNSHPTDLAYLGLDSTRVTLGTCSG